MTQLTGKVIPMPCVCAPQEVNHQERTHKTTRDILLALESMVTITIGVCAVMSTAVFLFMCF